jgi:hypothetical protein
MAIHFDEWFAMREFATHPDTDPMQSALNAVKNLHTMRSQEAFAILANAAKAADSQGNANLARKIREIEHEYSMHVRAQQRGIEDDPDKALQHLIQNALSSLGADQQQTTDYLSSGSGRSAPVVM